MRLRWGVSKTKWLFRVVFSGANCVYVLAPCVLLGKGDIPAPALKTLQDALLNIILGRVLGIAGWWVVQITLFCLNVYCSYVSQVFPLYERPINPLWLYINMSFHWYIIVVRSIEIVNSVYDRHLLVLYAIYLLTDIIRKLRLEMKHIIVSVFMLL